MTDLNAQILFDTLKGRLELRWEAGRAGGNRPLELPQNEPTLRRPSLVGYLNVIHSNRIQIVGAEELRYLDGLDPRQRWDTVAKVFSKRPMAILLSNRAPIPEDLRDAANETGTPLWVSSKRGHELVAYLQYHLTRALARRTTSHGVFLEVYSLGVLITGGAGAGKSELALELITRGHRLIADDMPEFVLVEPDVLDGGCPPVLQDCLEVRGLGVLNVREMFGDSAVKRNKYLRLIVHLEPLSEFNEEALDRLHGTASTRDILEVAVPEITIPVAPGRNLAVLVEAAVRNHLLKLKGIDSSARFVERHAALMAQAS
jgi:HPr kinase/phosphorylase